MALNSKQRAHLRGMANSLDAIFQVGKGGINDNMIKQINDTLNVRELIKITVLENSDYNARMACDEIVLATGAEPVQVIGNKLVIYKESNDKKIIELP